MQGSECNRGNDWRGELDRPVQTFLRHAKMFFDWLDEYMPTVRTLVSRMLQTLDASGRTLPQPLHALNVKQWMEMREFFVKVGHHGHRATREEFDRRLYEFESFLLTRLRPRTFADVERLDALIQEGERSDQP